MELAKTWSSVGPQRKCVITMVCEPRLVHSLYAHTLREFSQNFTHACIKYSDLNKNGAIYNCNHLFEDSFFPAYVN